MTEMDTHVMVISISIKEVAIEGKSTINASCVNGLLGSQAVTSHSSATMAPFFTLTKHHGLSILA